MSLQLTSLEGTWLWRCDGCGVETLPADDPGSGGEGWAEDRYPGGPHHWCPECIVLDGIDVGEDLDWQVAWDELEANHDVDRLSRPLRLGVSLLNVVLFPEVRSESLGYVRARLARDRAGWVLRWRKLVLLWRQLRLRWLERELRWRL